MKLSIKYWKPGARGLDGAGKREREGSYESGPYEEKVKLELYLCLLFFFFLILTSLFSSSFYFFIFSFYFFNFLFYIGV